MHAHVSAPCRAPIRPQELHCKLWSEQVSIANTYIEYWPNSSWWWSGMWCKGRNLIYLTQLASCMVMSEKEDIPLHRVGWGSRRSIPWLLVFSSSGFMFRFKKPCSGSSHRPRRVFGGALASLSLAGSWILQIGYSTGQKTLFKFTLVTVMFRYSAMYLFIFLQRFRWKERKHWLNKQENLWR